MLDKVFKVVVSVLGKIKQFFSTPYNFIFVISLLILFIAFILFCIGKSKLDKKMEKDINDYIFTKALSLRNTWLKSAISWMLTEYLFVIVPFEASIIVIHLSSSNAEQYSNVILFYSIISLIFIVIGFEINPKKHTRCYRKAFEKVDSAINDFIVNYDGNKNKLDRYRVNLSNAINEGEKIISNSYEVD